MKTTILILCILSGHIFLIAQNFNPSKNDPLSSHEILSEAPSPSVGGGNCIPIPARMGKKCKIF